MKTGKQVLCFLLALALVFGLLPTTVQPVQAAEAAQPAANPVVKFQFSIAGAGTIVVDGEDKGTEVEVDSSGSLTFSVEAPGYQVNVVLFGGNRPVAPNSDGTYTISGVQGNASVVIMVEKKDNQALSFAVSGAAVTVDGVDYTNADYSALYNEKITFTVIPEEEGSEVTVTADNCTIADHGNGTYTTSGITAATRITVSASGQAPKVFYKVNFSFNIPGVASVFVDDVDMGTSLDVEQGTDVTFRIVAPGYKVGVLLLGGTRPIPANGDGSYTISNVMANRSITVMLMETVAGKAEVTFRCINAKVTVNDVDYTDVTYSHPGGSFRFTVEVPEGYYVQSVTASPDQEILCATEMQNQKVRYSIACIDPGAGDGITIDIIAAEGEENTWPLEYQYSLNGASLSYARVKSCAPTYEGALEIPETVIHNGVPLPVRQISDYAFIECYSLTELVLPDTVREVGIYAFAYTGLRHIRLSENLDSIGHECFFKCIYLEEITLPESLKVVPANAFDSCYALQTVKLPDNLRTLEKYAFWDCYALKEITIPAGIISIEKGTFMACKGLEQVTFLGPVTSIGESAFYGTTSLKHIDLPEGLTYLGESAFKTGGLEQIVLPVGITEIANGTFQSCGALYNVTFLGDVTVIEKSAFEATSALQEIDLPETLSEIGEYAFYESGLRKIRLPKNCTIIGQQAFTLSDLEVFEVEPENPTFQAGDDGVLYSKDGERLILYPYNKSNTTYTVLDGTKAIEAEAFYRAAHLECITFPGSLQDVGNYAFYHLPKLKTVILPEGLKDISGECAFAACYSLDELCFPSTLLDVSGKGTFESIGITELVLPAGMQDISGEHVFAACTALKRVVLPADMEEISGSRIFSGCNALSELELPKNLKKISGIYNFSNIAIEKLILPETLQEVRSGNFASCKRLSEVVLPEGLQVLGGGNFGACVSLTKVNLPAGLTELQYSIFAGCSALESIQIPEKVTNIGARCFFDCKKLKTIDLPAGLQTIGDYCFDGCTELESIELPIGLQSIGAYAFACTNITELSVPKTVTSWGDYPIGLTEQDESYALDTERTYSVYFAGDVPEWDLWYALPNMPNLHCYFPKDNVTWIEDLQYLIDCPYMFRISWRGVAISLPESLTLVENEQQPLTATMWPVGDTRLSLTWTSSDEGVVRVDEKGVLTGIAPGTATITASTGGGAYTAQCQVTVLEDSKPVFRDVPEDAWYYEAVRYTSEHGLFRGITETEFGPNRTMTRGMLVTVLYRLEGEPSVEGQTHPFTDVSANRYYSDAIAWAAGSGVVNGVTETLFAPEAPVTREQMVTILYRYANLKGADVTASGDLSGFPDGDQVKNYAKEAFRWAVGAGIIEGSYNGGVTTLSPRSSATRAQVAAVLMRYLQGVV